MGPKLKTLILYVRCVHMETRIYADSCQDWFDPSFEPAAFSCVECFHGLDWRCVLGVRPRYRFWIPPCAAAAAAAAAVTYRAAERSDLVSWLLRT